MKTFKFLTKKETAKVAGVVVMTVVLLGSAAYWRFKSDVNQNEAFYYRSIEAARTIYRQTNHPIAANIIKFIDEGKIKHVPYRCDFHSANATSDTLYYTIVTPANSLPCKIKQGSPYHFTCNGNVFALEKVSNMSDTYLGMSLLYGSFLHGCRMAYYEGDSSVKEDMSEIAALEFIGELLHSYPGYSVIFDKISDEMFTHYLENQGNIKFDLQLDTMIATLDLTALRLESNFFCMVFIMNCAFNVYERDTLINPLVQKLGFYEYLWKDKTGL